MDFEQGVHSGTNIRDGVKNKDGHIQVQTYNLSKVDFEGNTLDGSGSVELTFKNITDLSNVTVPDGNPNNWGVVNVTVSSQSRYFKFEWISNSGTSQKNGLLKNKGDTAVLRVTPRTDVSAGEHTESVVFMEQESRIGRVVEFQATVEPHPVTVTPAANVSKEYGQTLKPSDIKVSNVTGLEGKTVNTLADLGLKEIPGEKEHVSEAAGSTYQLNTEPVVVGCYVVTFSGAATVTVDKATPVLGWVNATAVDYNAPLRNSVIRGVHVNPHTRSRVEGGFAWTEGTASTTLTHSGEHEYTFTPSDGNHTTVTGKVYVAVGGDTGGGSSGGGPNNPTKTELKAEDHVETVYNGQPQTVPVTEKLMYRYKAQGAQSWTSGKPTDVGTYDVEPFPKKNRKSREKVE